MWMVGTRSGDRATATDAGTIAEARHGRSALAMGSIFAVSFETQCLSCHILAD